MVQTPHPFRGSWTIGAAGRRARRPMLPRGTTRMATVDTLSRSGAGHIEQGTLPSAHRTCSDSGLAVESPGQRHDARLGSHHDDPRELGTFGAVHGGDLHRSGGRRTLLLEKLDRDAGVLQGETSPVLLGVRRASTATRSGDEVMVTSATGGGVRRGLGAGFSPLNAAAAPDPGLQPRP